MNKRAIIVDLDGTLVLGNTLHEYIRAGMSVLLEQREYKKVASVMELLAKRKLHLISHKDMKFGVADIIGYPLAVKEALKKRLTKKWNKNLISYLNKQSDDKQIIIATAAFDFYVKDLVSWPFVATQYQDNPYKYECRGLHKLEEVKKWTKQNDCSLYQVITDHYDDYPLLCKCTKRVLVKPSAKTRREMGRLRYHIFEPQSPNFSQK